MITVVSLFAQAPQKFSYQAVVRDANNQLVISQAVGVRVSILQGGINGTVVYMETHTAVTNANGLITLQIGGGNIQSGNFANVDWSDGTYFLKTEMDPAGGTNYTIEGTQQLLSVPYALYANEAGNGFSGDYNDLSNLPQIPQIPQNVSAFNNDAGYLSNYTETDPTVPAWAKEANKPAYDYSEIANTPTIPTVPTNVSAFTNDAGYITMDSIQAIPTIPTNVSAFTNDAGYITMDSIPAIPTVPTSVSAFTNDVGYITGYTETDPQFNAWDKDYNDLINKPTIPIVPTNISAFTNDAGYITMDSIPAIPTVPTNVSAFTNDAGYLTTANVQEAANIPTLVSAFQNDAGYVTTSELNAANYITLSQVPAQVNADWDATSGAAQILNKPNLFSGSYNDLTNKPTLFSGDYNDLSNKPTLFSGNYNDLSNKPVLFDGNYNSLSNRPNLSAVAISGSYNDLTDKPNIPTVPTNISSFVNDMGYITVLPDSLGGISIESDPIFSAWDKDYNDLINTPTIPTIPSNISAFNNDAGYLTNYTETDPTIPAWAKEANKPAYDYSEIANTPTIPTIPTNVSSFTNDAGYITMDSIPTIPTVPNVLSAFTNDAGYLTNYTETDPTVPTWAKESNKPTYDYSEIANTPTIPTVPTNVSVFNNDAGYLTQMDVADMSNTIASLNQRIDSLNNVIAGMGGSTPSVTPGQPTVITGEVTNITTTSATCAAEIPNSGGLAVTDRGICWSLNPNPTLSDHYVAASAGGTGNFTVNITGLSIGSTYYVRAYATNMLGTTYGNQVIFYTPTYPTVVTADVVAGGSYTATGGGDVTATGGAPVTARGVCWSIYPNPTLNDAHTTNGEGIGSFASTLTGLSANTTYYVRAYATNMVGTVYGEQKTVMTIMSEMPVVETGDVTNVEISTVTFSGNVLFDGGYPITARGLCYGTTQNPTIDDAVTSNGTGNGSFSQNITGLTNNTTYYVRAYATNLAGTSYGAQKTFTTKNFGLTCSDMPTIVDVDGNTYHTIQINDQCWMKENLRTTKKPNGTDIPLNSGRYYPNGNANNVAVYGYLYTWSAVMNGASSSSANPSGVQGICPTGWHVPSDAEWTKMTNYLSSQDIFYCNNYYSNIAKVLASTTGWSSSSETCAVGNNQSANNATGFGALPAGYYYSSSSTYQNFSKNASFWSTRSYDNSNAYIFSLGHSGSHAGLSVYGGRSFGYSVRCLRD